MCYELEFSDGSTTVSSTVTSTHSPPSRAAAGRKKKSKCTKGVITPKLPKFADHEEKAEFMINVFKVKLCTRRRRHTWSGCPYAHLGETAKRRDPTTHHAVPCPEMKQGNRCPRGDQCPYSHHDFEYWLHPARYCTVMCNKGKNCDRSLCFFAHDEKELRSCSASVNEDGQTPATVFEECVNEPRSEVHDSSSSIENCAENCAEDLKSIASLTSVTDSFRSTSDRFQESSQQSKETPHSTDLCNDYPPSLFLNQNLTNTEMSNSEIHLGQLRRTTSETGKPLSVPEMCASTNICQLLGQQRSKPFGEAHFSIETQGSSQLNKSLSVGQAQHLSPTCHFSGLSGEFMPANGLQTLPSCPAMFDLLDRTSSMPSNQTFQSVMSTPLGSTSTHRLPTQNDLFQCPQMTALAPPPALSGPNPHQAMDSLPRTNQGLLLQTAALQNVSPASVLGGLSSQDLLCNNELMEVAKLIYNMQGGIQTLRPFEQNPPFFDPSCSLKTADEQGLVRDPLYSLQQTGNVSSLVHSSGFFFD